jgi:hypothetical protein
MTDDVPIGHAIPVPGGFANDIRIVKKMIGYLFRYNGNIPERSPVTIL